MIPTYTLQAKLLPARAFLRGLVCFLRVQATFLPAKKMSGRLRTEIVKKRSQILSKLCNKISIEKNQNHVGKKYNILITEIGKEDTFVGRAENYKPVVIKEKVRVGDFISVQIIDAASTYLVGSII